MRNYGQRKCPRCWNAGIQHNCPVTDEIRQALRDYRDAHGRRWKSLLCDDWANGRTDGLLQQARNLIGPTAIHKIRL